MYLSDPDYSSDVPELYEGDMALTKEQVQALRPTSKKPADWDQEAQTRGAIRNPRQLWPNGIIPFKISPRIGIIILLYFRQIIRVPYMYSKPFVIRVTSGIPF